MTSPCCCPNDDRVYAFTRRLDDDELLVVANLSGEATTVDAAQLPGWGGTEVLVTTVCGEPAGRDVGCLEPWEARVHRRRATRPTRLTHWQPRPGRTPAGPGRTQPASRCSTSACSGCSTGTCRPTVIRTCPDTVSPPAAIHAGGAICWVPGRRPGPAR